MRKLCTYINITSGTAESVQFFFGGVPRCASEIPRKVFHKHSSNTCDAFDDSGIPGITPESILQKTEVSHCHSSLVFNNT